MRSPVRDGEEILLRLDRLRSVRQLVEMYPHLFTEGGLRWTIFRRKHNGFDACIVRIGRRILIDTDQLERWMARHRGEDRLRDTRKREETPGRQRKSRR